MSIEINDAVFKVFPAMESERLFYRAYKKSDATALFSIRTHKKVAKYMDAPMMFTIDDAQNRIHNMLSDFEQQKGITWAIIDKDTNTLIGDFGVWRLDRQNARGEIGYVLHPDFWGKGYMKEAMITLINFVFNGLNLHSLEANVNPENENSKRMLLKFGFKKEAYFRQNYYYNGRFLDSEIYCLLQSDIT